MVEERVENQESQGTATKEAGPSILLVSPSTSHQNTNSSVSSPDTHLSKLSTSKAIVSVAEISPVSLLKARKRKLIRKPASSLEITSSPYKNDLETKKPQKKDGKVTSAESSKKQKRRIFDKPDERVKENWFCRLCAEERQEDMIQCLQCKDWLHTKCVGVSSRKKTFYCEECI